MMSTTGYRSNLLYLLAVDFGLLAHCRGINKSSRRQAFMANAAYRYEIFVFKMLKLIDSDSFSLFNPKEIED